MRLAWFSPVPPVRSGIAGCSADLIAALRADHEIDVYVDEVVARVAPAARSAHEFVWRQHRRPYDLTVFQLGNSSHHDYLWPYLFRYPGLAVLHDAHLHHARAAALLRTWRADDYRAEFAANHPRLNPALAELAVAGFDSHLYYLAPMTRLVALASRLTAVHARPLAAALREELPDARIEAIRLAHGTPVTDAQAAAVRGPLRARHGIADDAMLFGLFGGLTPDKRIPQVLDALAAIAPSAPTAHLLLGGGAVSHYDAAAAVRAHGLESRVTITGYIDTDAALTDAIAACDVTLNLRWPTAREMSGPWLRSLAAGKPTVIVDLTHLGDIPALDPQTWTLRNPGSGIRDTGSGMRDPRSAMRDAGSESPSPGSRIPSPDPVTVSIDIMDEAHSLRLAMRRLATDAALRASLGAAARRYWEREHSLPRMLEDYHRIIAAAASAPAPRVLLPPHLVTSGDRALQRLLQEMGVALSLR